MNSKYECIHKVTPLHTFKKWFSPNSSLKWLSKEKQYDQEHCVKNPYLFKKALGKIWT